MMMFPPSLPADVLTRAFRSTKGELGILPADVDQFLAACDRDHVEVLGWELWLVDHFGVLPNGDPAPSTGNWYGLIPTLDGIVPSVFGFEGDSRAAQQQIAALNILSLVASKWHPYLRLNFGLGG
jgi:hypothetical protein